jgi:hypothetical protein
MILPPGDRTGLIELPGPKWHLLQIRFRNRFPFLKEYRALEQWLGGYDDPWAATHLNSRSQQRHVVPVSGNRVYDYGDVFKRGF